MGERKRATIYLDADLHRALRLKAAATNRSMSEMVNDAVRMALAEDAVDLAAVDQRVAEPSVSFEAFVRELHERGRIKAVDQTFCDRGDRSDLDEAGSSTDRSMTHHLGHGAARLPGCEKLTGATSMYRVRQGQYRTTYLVDDAARSVDVLKVGHRREVDRRGL